MVEISECEGEGESTRIDFNLNKHTAYKNLVRQISGDALHAGSAKSLKESVKRNPRRQELQKQITALQDKV